MEGLAEDKEPKKIHGTLVKVTDENADEVAKAIMEQFRKRYRDVKGHSGSNW